MNIVSAHVIVCDPAKYLVAETPGFDSIFVAGDGFTLSLQTEEAARSLADALEQALFLFRARRESAEELAGAA